MPEGLDVIALISGGKDSLFSLLHCLQNGHRVVALANLYPPTSLPSTIAGRSYDPSSQLFAPETDYSIDGGESSDLNSFMYQTVGHSVIPLYSIVLQLPLYRQEITGTSVQQSQYYDTSPSLPTHLLNDNLEQDETEDLVPLLRRIIAAHPHANAISTGAILSTYQRTRVESVAVRLGLVPLSYLWQYPILSPPPARCGSSPANLGHRSDSLTGLLEDIASAGIDARIVKIASAGVSEKLLFANVADRNTQSRLIAGLAPFFEADDEISLRGAVLGEGGEYETIALNGPKSVWKGGRIEVDHNTDEAYSEGGVAYFRIGKARVVPHKDEETNFDNDSDELAIRSPDFVVVPSPFDEQFNRVRRKLMSSDNTCDRPQDDTSGPHPERKYIAVLPGSHNGQDGLDGSPENAIKCLSMPLELSCTATSNMIAINNLTSASITRHLIASSKDSSTTNAECQSQTAAAQMQTILSELPRLLIQLARTYNFAILLPTHISSANLLLSSMSDFVTVNPVYAQIYPAGLPNPPARVTVATHLPESILVSLSLVFDLCNLDQKRGLHVQGRSYWAPANIGPYSQAIAVPLQQKIAYQNSFAMKDEGEKSNTMSDTNDDCDDDGSHDNVDDEDDNRYLEIVHMAGQIPLVPSSMKLHEGTFLDTALLSLQHLWRVSQERRVDVWPWGVAYLANDSQIGLQTCVETASSVWREIHFSPTWSSSSNTGSRADDRINNDSDDDSDSSDDESVDVWDIQHNRFQQTSFRHTQIRVGKHLHVLPNHQLLHQPKVLNQSNQEEHDHVPPFIAVVVKTLPRNAAIEWWSNGIAGLTKLFSSTPTTAKNPIRKPTWRRKVFSWGSVSCLAISPNRHKPNDSIRFISCFIRKKASGRGEDVGGGGGGDSDVPTDVDQIVNLADDDDDDNSDHDGDKDNQRTQTPRSEKQIRLSRAIAFLSTSTTEPASFSNSSAIMVNTATADTTTINATNSDNKASDPTLSTTTTTAPPASTSDPITTSDISRLQSPFSKLVSNMSIIPCHSVWGSATTSRIHRHSHRHRHSRGDNTIAQREKRGKDDDENDNTSKNESSQVEELDLAILLHVNVDGHRRR